jgi:hypothetical protein
MPTFLVTSPDGRKLKITGPDGATQQDAIAMAQKNLGNPEKSEGQGYIPEKPGIKDYARTALDNVLQGSTFGIADEITDRIGAGVASVATGQKYGDMLKEARETTKARQDEQLQEMPVTAIGANVVGGLLTGGAGATTKAGAAISNSLRNGNIAARVAKGAAVGATSGAAYGAGTAQDGQRLEGAASGAVAGGVIGGAAPAVIAAGRGVKNAVIPKIGDELKPLAKRARDFGIPLRADQVAPTRIRKTVQKISQELPLSGADGFEDTQRKAFTKAVAKTIGQDAEDLGPGTVKKFLSAAKQKFDSVLDGETISFSRGDLKVLDDIAINADESIDPGLSLIVRKNIDKLQASLSTGDIDGQKLASIRSELLKKATRAQGGAKQFLGDVVEFIDDNIERSVHPKKAETLKTARREWRNFKTIQPLLKKSTSGGINPTELLNKVTSSKYIDASKAAVGEDDLIDLARIGKEFLPTRGGSDTFQKSIIGGGAGALGLTALSNPLLAATLGAKAAAGLAVNRGVQNTVSSQKLIDLALKAPAPKRLPNIPINPLIAAESAATR